MYTLPRYSPNQRQELTQQFGKPQTLPHFNHYYTHFNELLEPYLFNLNQPAVPTLEGNWYSFNELDTMPFLSVYRKIIEATRLFKQTKLL